MTEGPQEGETFSNAAKREFLIDHPNLLSGDYFREKAYPETTLKPLPAEQNDGKITTHETAVPRSGSQFSSQRIKIGFFLNCKTVDAASAMVIADAARTEAAKFPLVFIPARETLELALHSGCDAESGKMDFSCLGKNIEAFPGIRMLIRADSFSLPSVLPGSIRVNLSLTDTFFAFTHLPMVFKLPVERESDIPSTLSRLFEQVFRTALEKATPMAWYCRSFPGDKTAITINAGKNSGLRRNDLLTIRSGGRIVLSPSGFPAGWIPGEERGIVRVDTLFGRDLAVCSIKTGEGPRPDDIIMKQVSEP